jgi:hypothetical protein
LAFVGYRKADQLDNKAITIWGRDGTPPAAPMNMALIPPRWQGLMWGTLPFGSSLLALLLLFVPDEPLPGDRLIAPSEAEDLEPGRLAI